LESVILDDAIYVSRIAYNAKGQRVLIAYGNGVMTRYAHDEQTFRLERLRSERFTQSEDLTYQPRGSVLQDFRYSYDLAGNILSIHDRAPGCGLPGRLDELDRTFIYDPIYRLVFANGREHDQPQPVLPPWTDIPTGTDPTKTRFYTRGYQYDRAGNLRKMKHGASGNGNSFRRVLDIVPGNNRLHEVSTGQTSYAYAYDDNGNMIQEYTNRHFAWDHADRMKGFANTPDGSGHSSVEARYLYGADGMRVKKWVRKNGNLSGSIVYVDGIFEHHHWIESGQKKQNNHLHIMDDQQRIAIVRRGEVYPGDLGPDVQYHLGDHLGSSNVVVNDGGQWTNHEEYFPYGETSFGSFVKKRFRFTGKERDGESGFYYHGARYYATWLGRWVSIDPLQTDTTPGRANGAYQSERHKNGNPYRESLTQPIKRLSSTYAYAQDNPLNAIDPSGLQEKWIELTGDETISFTDKASNVSSIVGSIAEFGGRTPQNIYEDLFVCAYNVVMKKGRYMLETRNWSPLMSWGGVANAVSGTFALMSLGLDLLELVAGVKVSDTVKTEVSLGSAGASVFGAGATLGRLPWSAVFGGGGAGLGTMATATSGILSAFYLGVMAGEGINFLWKEVTGKTLGVWIYDVFNESKRIEPLIKHTQSWWTRYGETMLFQYVDKDTGKVITVVKNRVIDLDPIDLSIPPDIKIEFKKR
jgi:RHS repeat-associated protein